MRSGSRGVSRWALPVVVISLACPRTAGAQASPNAVIAEQLFREGERLFTSGSTHEACEKFAASQKMDAAPGTLNNLALCHEKEGKTASAWFELNELAGLAARAGKKDREEVARSHAVLLEKSLARVLVQVPAGVRIASVEVDGSSLDPAALGAPFPMDPGTHSFRLTDDRGRKAGAELLVPAGPGTTPLETTFAAEPAQPFSATPPSPPAPLAHASEGSASSGGTKTVGWVLVGAGAVGVAAGGVLGLVASSHRNDRPNDAAFTFATASDVAVGVGLAAAAVGAVLLVVLPSKARHAGAWNVAPRFTYGGAELRLAGAF